jgi:hypothetical protein
MTLDQDFSSVQGGIWMFLPPLCVCKKTIFVTGCRLTHFHHEIAFTPLE